MKIFDITTFFSTGRGGITTYLERKAQLANLLGRGAGTIEHQLILGGPRDEVSKFHGSTCHWVKSRACGWNPHYRYLCNFFKIRRILQQEKPAVIETSDPYWIPIYLFMMRRQITNPPPKLLLFYRVDFPDTYVLPFLEKYAAWAKGLAERLCWWYLRTMLNHLDGVIVHSEVMKEKLIKRSITSPIHVVGNLTNSQVFAEAQPNAEFNELLRDRFGEFKKLILFCGRLSFEKGVDLLLKAYEQLRDDVSQPILVIVGDGPMRDQISSLAADTSKRIYYIPATPDRTYLASIFASCDFMVMPGPYETFSIVTLEAIVAGLPVVGIRGTGGISALIKPGVGFLCENSNANELVENMRRAIIPKGSWYREEVRRQIIENYRPERVYSKLLQAYGIDDEGNQSHVAMGK